MLICSQKLGTIHDTSEPCEAPTGSIIMYETQKPLAYLQRTYGHGSAAGSSGDFS